MNTGGIVVPAKSRRNVIRISTNRIRQALDDFSPWKGLIYDCGKHGPRLSTIESLEQAAAKGAVLSARWHKLPFGTKESDTVWARCREADHGGCGAFARTLQGLGLGILTPANPTPAEFIRQTAGPEYPILGATPTVEALYADVFQSSSNKDAEEGKFSEGVYLGWLREAGASKRIVGQLEGGYATHVVWLWWVG
jgi:hypothetical protein